ncbi:MAG: DUF4301 family protein [Alistipes sp.]|nr:DUF4301 family protein [Candidatus Alistipes equi]
MFTQTEKKQILAHGLSVKQAEAQIENFKKGFPSLPISRAASYEDGILVLSKEEIEHLCKEFEAKKDSLSIVKFVPASGAATRMFKELFEYLNDGKQSECVDSVLKNLKKFAFYKELKKYISPSSTPKEIISAILKEGLGYGSLPKGLITFHKYGRSARKAIEEHLVEAALYGTSNGIARLHFTVSPEHEGEFIKFLSKKAKKYEKHYGIRYDISFSIQRPSTDTIAVNMDNTPFLTDDGNLLFRPAGHGALIENLADINADLIFIKNIDNVTTDSQREDTILYKKALAALLLQIQEKCFDFAKKIDGKKDVWDELRTFITDKLMIKLPENADHKLLEKIIKRPIRVCGMVKNEGEPGGGPFWVKNEDGTESLQIAESSQIAAEDLPLMQAATHFNPVDLICATKDYNAKVYPLKEFVDPKTGFISKKSSSGRDLRAQELPGLWNGAMAFWNTIFVDVPITTFSPVKTVQALLKRQHQN